MICLSHSLSFCLCLVWQVLRYIFSGAESEATNFPSIVEVRIVVAGNVVGNVGARYLERLSQRLSGIIVSLQILDLPFFKSVQLPESENCDSSQVTVT